MTPDECQRMLREVEATWPKSDRNAWTEGQVVVWLKTLAPLDFRDALSALDCLRESCKWLPSHAEFIENARAAAKARFDYDEVRRTRAIAESTSGLASLESTAAWIAKCREQLANAKGPLAKPLGGVLKP